MDKFLDLLRESVLVQASLALIVLITVCVMFVQGQQIPSELLSLMGVILGYYFGAKNQQFVTRVIGQSRRGEN